MRAQIPETLEDASNEDNCPNCIPNVAEDESRDTSLVTPDSVPKYIVGKPLHDYDATGENEPAKDTFLVLSRRRWGQRCDHAYRFSKAKSLWLMEPHNPIRLAAIRVITNPYFEPFVIVTILTNCVFLALKDPPEVADGLVASLQFVTAASSIVRYVFAAIYTSEMVLKILAMGFVLHSYAYLRDPWNRLDFVVVILGYVTLIPSIANLSGIRTFRLLRALRTISAMKGLRTVVNTLLQSMKMFSDVMFLFFFFLCVMALIGLQLFLGVLRNKCVWNTALVTAQGYATNNSYWYMKNGGPLLCGNGPAAGMCPVNTTCRQVGGNPNYGYTNFDNFGSAFIMAFQLLTMDFWENQYNVVIRAAGTPYMLYYLPAIFFGSFFLYNLVLAVVTIAFTKESSDAKLENIQRHQLKRTDQSYDVDEDTLKQLRLLREDPRIYTSFSSRCHRCKQNGEEQRLRKNSTLMKTFKEVAVDEGCESSLVQTVSCWGCIRKSMYNCVTHSHFESLIMSFIMLNTIVLALYYHRIDPSFSRILDISNQVLTAIFVLEMICKLIALGPKVYMKSSWNIFDGIIVIVSVIDTILELGKWRHSAMGASVFRSFRLFRILRLAQSWKTMDRLLGTIAKCLGPLSNITLILALVIYIFAVLGTSLFGSSYTNDKFGSEGVPRWNFKDFGHSFMLVFRIICGEWIEPLWDCMRANNPAVVLFFLPAFIFGNFLVLNLFLALLIDSFHKKENKKSAKEGKSVLAQILKKVKTRNTEVLIVTKQRRTQSSEASLDASVDGIAENSGVETQEEIDDCLPSCCPLPPCCWRRHHAWLKFRYQVRCFVQNKHFERLILVLIFISSFVLIFEDSHLQEKPELQSALNVLNYVFCVAFTLEMLLKMIGFGITKYFASAWNCLDAFIVAISLTVVASEKSLSVFRALRTVRALRPLRALSRLHGMKVTINALFSSIPGIGNVLLVCLVFWLIFSILGVQLFAGKFYKCVDSEGNRLPVSVVPNKAMCDYLSHNRTYKWKNSDINFDNVANGFLVLFQVATFEGWMEVMKDAVDATEVDEQPQEENNPAAYTYFVIFIIIGAFFVFNLFISVIIDNFQKLKANYDHGVGVFLTEKQRKWVVLLKEAARKKPKSKQESNKPQDWLRGLLFDVVTSDKFEIAILSVVTLNMILMMIQHYDQSDSVTSALHIPVALFTRVLSIFFTAVFLLEAIVKLLAMGLHYFKIAWNVFDFVIVFASITGVVLDFADTEKKINPSVLRVLRIFRVARLLKFLNFAKGVRQLVLALIISLPSLLNVGTLLFIIVFIYAIIGMSLFGNIKHQGSINDMDNFEDLFKSMLLLFRLTTSAGWNDILDSLSVAPPNCDPSYKGLANGDCGEKSTAIIYLVSYVFIIFLIMVNMYIAILLENVSMVYEEEAFVISKATIDNFYDVWNSFAPNGESTIPYEELSDFASKLGKPLTIPQPNAMKIFSLRIPLRRGKRVHVFDVIKSVVKRALEKEGHLESPQDFDLIVEKLEMQFMGSRRSLKRRIGSANAKEVAAIAIQRAFRAHQRKQRFQDVVQIARHHSQVSDHQIKVKCVSDDTSATDIPNGGNRSCSTNPNRSISITVPKEDEYLTNANASLAADDVFDNSHFHTDTKQHATEGHSSVQRQRKKGITHIFVMESSV